MKRSEISDDLWEEFTENLGFDPEEDEQEALDYFEESYIGTYRSVAEYAEELLTDCGYFRNVPDSLQMYFDFKAYGRDLVLGGDIFTIELGWDCHIFSNL